VASDDEAIPKNWERHDATYLLAANTSELDFFNVALADGC
jgi:hypothetical protein